MDRTQWQKRNLLMVSLIWENRAIPQYRWSILEEQQNLMRPLFGLLKDYSLVILGDREFGSMGLANWLKHEGVGFCLRHKQGLRAQKLIQSAF